MQDLLSEIKNVQSVMGSYVHINGNKEMISDLPKIFLNKMQDVGGVFDRVIKVALATNMHTSTIEFKYDEAVIFLRPIDQESCLISFCETDVNKKLLNMTTGMLINDLKKGVEEARKSAGKGAPEKPAPPPASEPEPPSEPPPPTVDVNKIIHAGPMARIFQDIQDALAMAIGPISEMVMKDSVKHWAETGSCSQERLPELVDLLIAEIDDVSLEAEFKLAIKKHL